MLKEPLVSHEVPINYLECSKQFNDYDYALVHLFVNHPKYLEFFKQSIKEGRKVLLDNSAYEINTNPELLNLYPAGYFPMDAYADYIKELQPTEYVLPDVKSSCKKTIDSVNQWLNKYSDLPGKKIGVIHGSNIDELQRCYDVLDKVCDKIAFPFESWWFELLIDKNTRLEDIRVKIVSKLKINKNKPHHLLGCILPQEFELWKNVDWIDTIDTSSPITNAIEGKVIEKKMLIKPSTTIHGSFNIPYEENIAKQMKENAELFKKYFISIKNQRGN